MRCTVEAPVLPLQPSPSLLAFVQRQVSQAQPYTGQERRAEPRKLLAKPVLVYPADENFSPSGPPLTMVIRDISPRGLELVHEEPFDCPLILVRISFPEIESLVGAVVRWSRPAGPFYAMGCEIHSLFDNVVPPAEH
jgi:PilZ domain